MRAADASRSGVLARGTPLTRSRLGSGGGARFPLLQSSGFEPGPPRRLSVCLFTGRAA